MYWMTLVEKFIVLGCLLSIAFVITAGWLLRVLTFVNIYAAFLFTETYDVLKGIGDGFIWVGAIFAVN